MTLDEAIKHAEGTAEKNEKKAKSYPRPDKNVKGSGRKYNDCIECASEHRQLAEWLKELKQLREQEPCDDVCEWFEQYVDIATDIVELRFSDGTVKRAKRGLYMRGIEKSIRKMLIDQIANEEKQEPKIKVLERDEVVRKLGTVDIYQARAWITLLNDLEYLKLKICEVEE